MKIDGKTSKLILLVTAAILAAVAFYLFVIPAMQKNSEVSLNNANADFLKAKADKLKLEAEQEARRETEKELEERKIHIEHLVKEIALRLKNKALDDCKSKYPPAGWAAMLGKFDDPRGDCFKKVDNLNNTGYFLQKALEEYKQNNPLSMPFNWEVEIANGQFHWWYSDLQ